MSANISSLTRLKVPFFRTAISETEIDEVVSCLRSGGLTTGPRGRQVEESCAVAVRARHAIAVIACAAALHLAVEALGLRPGQGVLVPTLTFAATAEVVRYQGAIPILVDCDPATLNMDLDDAESKLERLRGGWLNFPSDLPVVGIMPVHVGGMMMDMHAVRELARRYELWVVEDAAHAFPAAQRSDGEQEWRFCGENTSDVTCFSFYTNKTITTGEGGMATTADQALADRMRQMSLHGLSSDAWGRYSGRGGWDYRIVAPGYKYNLTDIAASLGNHQLARAEEMRRDRQAIARQYSEAFRSVPELELPLDPVDRLHAWHLYPIRLRLNQLAINRNQFMEQLREEGVGSSVHWRPLHLHPYYQETFGWTPENLPVATEEWERLVSLPLFPSMTDEERDYVVRTVIELCQRHTVR
ncbi:MAG: DegT/DnrJ/EryC1/StrS family aminotransferase [Pirellulaceae bacterium]